ncbi:hypothetical protein BROUX41_005093 [Berkeleyomyces rouxiae]|uniref:uncharacterized protein n=1 Tax=Berkeleyomyces rouxiae TaxID=2035830 RepID=UPI003B801424
MPPSFSSAVATAFEDIFSNPQPFPKQPPPAEHHNHRQKSTYPTPDSPRLVRRTPSSRSATRSSSRSKLNFRHLLRRRWGSLSSPAIDNEKTQDLKRLGKCVNNNADSDASALNKALNAQHPSPHTFIPMMAGRRLSQHSQHLYQVDELPAESEAAERESLESAGTTTTAESSGCSTPTSAGPSRGRQYGPNLLATDTYSDAASMHTHAHTQRRWSAPFRTHTSPQRPASHSFAYAQRRRPSLTTPRSLSFAYGPPPSTTAWVPGGSGGSAEDPVGLGLALAGGRPLHTSGADAGGGYPFPQQAQYHTRTRSLPPHLAGVSGELRTPQKMKKRPVAE